VTAPAGAIVGLYVDLVARVGLNDIIETQTGRRYAVLAVREQTRGKHVGRQHLKVIVLGDEERIGENSTVHRIRWYSRGRGRR
jgi:hypothetical protein